MRLWRFEKQYAEELVEGLLRRERGGSTGWGDGVASPRVRHPGLLEVIVAIGRSSKGVDFAGRDRVPTQIVVPILAPTNAEDRKEVVDKALIECLARESFRSCVREARDVSDIVRAVGKR